MTKCDAMSNFWKKEGLRFDQSKNRENLVKKSQQNIWIPSCDQNLQYVLPLHGELCLS